jgi:hypothetical protein
MYVATPSWDGGYQSNGMPNYLTWETSWTNSYSYSYPSEPAYYSYTVQVPYEYYQETEVTVDFLGRVIAQSIVMPRAGWIPQLGLFYTQIGATGNVEILVCKCTNGKPDGDKVITQVTLNRADMKKYPEETIVPIPPIMVAAGERLGFFEITQGAHYAALGDAGFTEGTLFLGNDGVYIQGDLTRDRKMKVYMAQFAAPRTEVGLQNVSLSGGISEIAISTEIPKLQGATLAIEMQIGGIWERMGGDNLGKLASMPDIVPLRAVFTGTADIQCGLQLGANRVIAALPTVSSTITSTAITTPAKRYFQVDLDVDVWDATKNTIVVKLLTGGGYATETASTTSIVLDGDQPGFKKLRTTFDVGSTVTSYKVKHTLTRTADGPNPRRLERTSIATG